jgi:hypothetical protein
MLLGVSYDRMFVLGKAEIFHEEKEWRRQWQLGLLFESLASGLRFSVGVVRVAFHLA